MPREDIFSSISVSVPFIIACATLPVALYSITRRPISSSSPRGTTRFLSTSCTFLNPLRISSISSAKISLPLCISIARSQSSFISATLCEETIIVAPRSSISSTIIAFTTFLIAGSSPSKASSSIRHFVMQESPIITTACRFIPFENSAMRLFVGRPSLAVSRSYTSSEKSG